MALKLISLKGIKRLKVIYAIAFIIIALSNIASTFVIFNMLAKNKGDSRIINIAGRQRMLSQRITKCILAIANTNEKSEQEEHLAELQLSFAEWEKAQRGLQNGDKELGLTTKEQSESIKQLFKDISPCYDAIAINITRFFEEIKTLKEPYKISASAKIVSKEILKQEHYFLKLMDSITFEFDHESKNKIEKLILIEDLILIIALSMLLLEFLIVFRPTLENLIYSMNELISVNKTLIDSESKLIESNKTKEMVITILGHDLRGPIGNINGVINLILDKNILKDEDEIELFKELKKSSENTYNLLLNVLLWSKTSTNGLEQEKREVDIVLAILESVDLYFKIAEQKGIKIENRVNQFIKIYSDPFMIKTILRNLIANAIKFTESGGKITVDAVESDAEIRISVMDTGVGMSKEKVGKLFKTNMNISSRGTDGETGTGLGLILCAEFAMKLGGKVEVESVLGKGTTFILILSKKEGKKEL